MLGQPLRGLGPTSLSDMGIPELGDPILDLLVPVPPKGKDRPRTTKSGHVYTAAKTASTEQSIRSEWAVQGEIQLPTGVPLWVHILAAFDRPKAHYAVDGSLKQRYADMQWVTKAPDGDNILKLATDSLNKYAWDDDRAFSCSIVVKSWSDRSYPYILIRAGVLNV